MQRRRSHLWGSVEYLCPLCERHVIVRDQLLGMFQQEIVVNPGNPTIPHELDDSETTPLIDEMRELDESLFDGL